MRHVKDAGLLALLISLCLVWFGLALSSCGGLTPRESCAVDFSACLAEAPPGIDCHHSYEACMSEVGDAR